MFPLPTLWLWALQGRSLLTLFTVFPQHPGHEKCSIVSREWTKEWMFGSDKVVVPLTPVSSAHLWLRWWWWEEKSGKGRNHWFWWRDEGDASYVTKGELKGAQDLVWALQSNVMATWKAKASRSLALVQEIVPHVSYCHLYAVISQWWTEDDNSIPKNSIWGICHVACRNK